MMITLVTGDAGYTGSHTVYAVPSETRRAGRLIPTRFAKIGGGRHASARWNRLLLTFGNGK